MDLQGIVDIRCSFCSKVPRPNALACTNGHPICSQCVNFVGSCPKDISSSSKRISSVTCTDEEEDEKIPRLDEVVEAGASGATCFASCSTCFISRSTCGMGFVKCNIPIFKTIFDNSMHMCQHPGCGMEVIGTKLDRHESYCIYATRVKCQGRHSCGERYISIHNYPDHLADRHQVEIFNTARRASLVNFHGYFGTSTTDRMLVLTMFHEYNTYFGLTLIIRDERLHFFISQLKSLSEVDHLFMYKLGLASPEGLRQIHGGVVRTIFEVEMTMELEDCMIVPQADITEFVLSHADAEQLLVDVFIFCPEQSKSYMHWKPMKQDDQSGNINAVDRGKPAVNRGKPLTDCDHQDASETPESNQT